MEINKIYNENNLETMAKMPDNFIDLTITSPPYDNLRTYKGFEWNFNKVANELYRVTKQGGVVVWVVGDATIKGSETGTSFKQALYFKGIGFNLHDTMIYLKNGFAYPQITRYHQVFEYMFVLSKGKLKTFNPIKDRKNKKAGNKIHGVQRKKDGRLHQISQKGKVISEYGMRYNIWQINVGEHKSSHDEIAFQHPAIFPEKLAHDHIISWSNEGDLVYDPFMGSGTTAKMAILTNRNYIGSEVSDEYCKIAEERLVTIHDLLL